MSRWSSAEVVVVGAGVGGLATALTLGRSGHRVTVIERDATPLPADAHEAFAWDRRGAPQVRHSHAFLARLRNLLRDRHPDVLADLLAAGATELAFVDMLPADIADRSPRPGDEDLVALACRRTTFEWVLRRAALAEPGVTLLDGVTVESLQGRPAGDEPAVVTGVRCRRDGRGPTPPGPARLDLDADLVVAAGGRRAPLTAWLSPLGVELAETVEDTGIVYLSRFYRLADGAEAPTQDGPIGGDLGYLKYAVFVGDNRTYSITFAVPTGDEVLRRSLLDPDGFEQAARTLPATAGWAAPGVGEAVTGVEVMARLLNRIRRFTHDGRPVVVGLAAVGDAHTCTNPLYGRGCSLAVVQAELLADAMAAHPDDPEARHQAYEDAVAREVEPWYRAAVLADRQGRAWVARERRRRAAATTDDAASSDDPPGEDPPGDDPPGDEEAGAVDLVRHGLMPAARTDADVFRAFLRMFNLLEPPEQLMADPHVVATVLRTYQERDQRPPEAPLGPPRREMLTALGV